MSGPAQIPAAALGGGAATSRKGVKWDEATIAEHDKERGTRMRIAEPKTPFRHGQARGSMDSDDDSVSADAVSASGGTTGTGSTAGLPGAGGQAPGDARIRAALQGAWDDSSDAMTHDEWDSFTASSASPTSTIEGGSRRASAGSMDPYSTSSLDAADGAARKQRRAGSERPSSSGSESSRRSALSNSHSHLGMHAHFAGTTAGGAVAPAGVVSQRRPVVPPMQGMPSGGFVPEAHDAEYDSPQHRDFTARRRAHYQKEFLPAKGLKDLLKRGAAAADDDDEEDVDMASDSDTPASSAAAIATSGTYTASSGVAFPAQPSAYHQLGAPAMLPSGYGQPYGIGGYSAASFGGAPGGHHAVPADAAPGYSGAFVSGGAFGRIGAGQPLPSYSRSAEDTDEPMDDT